MWRHVTEFAYLVKVPHRSVTFVCTALKKMVEGKPMNVVELGSAKGQPVNTG